jgi:hypothetical protein
VNDSKRIADLRLSKMTIVFVRYVYPAVILWALRERRRNQAVVVKEAAKIGSEAARIVVSAQKGAQTLRRLTYVIAVATILNTAFIVYSALK